jgi:hypothetical protein
MTPSESSNFLITKSKGTKIIEILYKKNQKPNFKKWLMTPNMIKTNRLMKYVNQFNTQMRNSAKKFRFWNKNTNGNVGNEKLNKSNENTVEIITHKLRQSEERTQGVEDKAEEILSTDSLKEKKNKHTQYSQELWWHSQERKSKNLGDKLGSWNTNQKHEIGVSWNYNRKISKSREIYEHSNIGVF